MSTKEALLEEIEKAPEPLLDEVLDFIRFLTGKLRSDGRLTATASESSLKKDWLSPEEDEAWRDL
ncbi:MAG: DUF2281 domain-containing protein [Planctomycetota bacterium]|nr:DUF2281 domain-containing protein [Planctomycetota bacterium]